MSRANPTSFLAHFVQIMSLGRGPHRLDSQPHPRSRLCPHHRWFVKQRRPTKPYIGLQLLEEIPPYSVSYHCTGSGNPARAGDTACCGALINSSWQVARASFQMQGPLASSDPPLICLPIAHNISRGCSAKIATAECFVWIL